MSCFVCVLVLWKKLDWTETREREREIQSSAQLIYLCGPIFTSFPGRRGVMERPMCSKIQSLEFGMYPLEKKKILKKYAQFNWEENMLY